MRAAAFFTEEVLFSSFGAGVAGGQRGSVGFAIQSTFGGVVFGGHAGSLGVLLQSSCVVGGGGEVVVVVVMVDLHLQKKNDLQN